MPPFDKAFGALMTDLTDAGKLDETLVVVAAEFGRSPKITRSNSGREHWPECYSVLFAGGGIKGGQVYGKSDKIAGRPAENPVTPADFVATIYHCLGIDSSGEIHDQANRPIALSKGEPISRAGGVKYSARGASGLRSPTEDRSRSERSSFAKRRPLAERAEYFIPSRSVPASPRPRRRRSWPARWPAC